MCASWGLVSTIARSRLFLFLIQVEEARAETNRLACERQSKAQLVEQLEMTEKELDSVKQLLAEAERKLRTGEGAMEGLGESGGMLQTLLQVRRLRISLPDRPHC